jgi:hypothetical protein
MTDLDPDRFTLRQAAQARDASPARLARVSACDFAVEA